MLCLIPQVFGTTAPSEYVGPSQCRSTAWSLGTVQRKFSVFELIPLNIHPWPTIFIEKAAITSNDVCSVSLLLLNAASHWYWVLKNHNGRSRTPLCMPRNKVDSTANGFPETTSASQLILKRKLPHKKILILFLLLKALERTGYWGVLWT